MKNLQHLLHLYDHSYNHPSYTPGDPARHIPTKIRHNIFLYNMSTWIGVIFLAAGIFFFLVFLPLADLKSFRFGNDSHETSGKIITIKSAHYSENETSYYEYVYEYEVKGNHYKGSSFDQYREEFEKDSTVQIQYQNASPSTSRIVGMRMGAAPPLVLLFILIFPCVGIGVSASSLLMGMRHVFLLRHGIVTEAMITETILFRNPDNQSQNTNDVYIEFVTSTGKTIKTRINISANKTARPGKTTSILYLPWDHSHSVFVKSMDPAERTLIE